MSQSVFYRNKTKSKEVEAIMKRLEDKDNPDMKVSFGGYMHGGDGFALKVGNLESITEYTTDLWKRIISAEGLMSVITTDMMTGNVNIKCVPEEKRQQSKSYLSSIVYLSLLGFLIYTLWIRHHQQ